MDVRLHNDSDLTAICVCDTGPGIPVSDRKAVLRCFYRAEPSRHEPGNGLGLSLVAAIARLHAMDLTIAEGDGCTISLRCRNGS